MSQDRQQSVNGLTDDGQIRSEDDESYRGSLKNEFTVSDSGEKGIKWLLHCQYTSDGSYA